MEVKAKVPEVEAKGPVEPLREIDNTDTFLAFVRPAPKCRVDTQNCRPDKDTTPHRRSAETGPDPEPVAESELVEEILL